MARLLFYLLSVAFNQRKIMSELTDLQAAVAANTAAIDAAAAVSAADKQTIAQQATMISDLQVALAAAQANVTDGAALAAMTAQLTADDAKLPIAVG